MRFIIGLAAGGLLALLLIDSPAMGYLEAWQESRAKAADPQALEQQLSTGAAGLDAAAVHSGVHAEVNVEPSAIERPTTPKPDASIPDASSPDAATPDITSPTSADPAPAHPDTADHPTTPPLEDFVREELAEVVEAYTHDLTTAGEDTLTIDSTGLASSPAIDESSTTSHALWIPFYSEASATGFAAHLSNTLQATFEVSKQAAGHYIVVYTGGDTSQWQAVKAELEQIIGPERRT
ncbi:MAG: hypothetical protein AAF529_18315 [Pseudomonadota bacterium]